MFKIPQITSNILGISLDGQGSPSININFPKTTEDCQSYGWGFGWYPSDQLSAMVTKDSASRSTQVLIDAITDWSSFRSTVFFCKVHGAHESYLHTETQPFSRSFAGRDWLFMHNGDLDKEALNQLDSKKSRSLEPLGNSDSEQAFCDLLTHVQQSGDARRISDIDPNMLHSWFLRFDSLGSADMSLTDGESIVCFQGSRSPKKLSYTRIQPPSNRDIYESDVAQITLNDPRDTYRTALIISSTPFSAGEWTQMQAEQMIIVRRGEVVWSSLPEESQLKQISTFIPVQPQTQSQTQTQPQTQTQAKQPPQERVLNVRAMSQTAEGTPLNYRLFEVKHTTNYEYTETVEHSTHSLRLQPTDDPIQEVVFSKLTISSPAEKIQFEDVFGNEAIHCIIDEPYNKLSVETTSRIKLYATPPDDHSLSRRQTSIPLLWMPWQRQMMMPYLLPSELPEAQLTELTEYAMSFVERNDYHLLKTIENMNSSIYQDYKYVSGSTAINATPFEIYTSRQGVCQDFANLLICLARLLNIPARYRMGYIYTGANYTNTIQSEASHAWAELYLPYVGWRGYDPTNGCRVFQDHIRVACGRNYRDATPTSGTIFKGGGTETLTVDVKMRELHED